MDLYTQDGHRLGRPTSPVLAMLEANGRAPEMVAWGERLFVLRDGRYVEGMALVLQPGELELG